MRKGHCIGTRDPPIGRVTPSRVSLIGSRASGFRPGSGLREIVAQASYEGSNTLSRERITASGRGSPAEAVKPLSWSASRALIAIVDASVQTCSRIWSGGSRHSPP